MRSHPAYLSAGCLGLLFLLLVLPGPQAVGAQTASTPAEVYQAGTAGTYLARFHGRRTASGERYDHEALTAAHRTLPLGTRVHVVNRRNGQAVVVRINDRGPFVKNRILELSGAAARQLGVAPEVYAEVELVLAEGQEAVAGLPPTISVQQAARSGSGGSIPVSTVAAPAAFAVQLGSYREEETARRLAASLSGAWVKPVQLDDALHFRVYFGRFEQREAAVEAQHDLAGRGHAGFVKKLDAEGQRP